MRMKFMTLKKWGLCSSVFTILFFSMALHSAPVTPMKVTSEEEPPELEGESSAQNPLPEATDIDNKELVDIPLPIRKPPAPKPPVHKDFTNTKLPKTDRWKGRDMAQIPQGVCRSFTYNPRGGKPDMRWSYAHPVSGCAYMALLQKWNKVCEKMQPSRGVKDRGCRVAQGHISKKNSWGYGSHRTHTHGYCFDLRPFRKGKFRNSPLTVSSGAYSRSYSKAFLKLAREFGSDTTYLNDRNIIRSGLSRHAGGHHNHIHICFKPGKGTRRACKKWKPDPNVCPRAGGWVKMLKKRGYLK